MATKIVAIIGFICGFVLFVLGSLGLVGAIIYYPEYNSLLICGPLWIVMSLAFIFTSYGIYNA